MGVDQFEFWEARIYISYLCKSEDSSHALTAAVCLTLIFSLD